jgi:hypothetical protein
MMVVLSYPVLQEAALSISSTGRLLVPQRYQPSTYTSVGKISDCSRSGSSGGDGCGSGCGSVVSFDKSDAAAAAAAAAAT